MSEENGAAKLSKRDLLAENQQLMTWVIGLVQGCEGCTHEARTWVDSLEGIHTEYKAEPD